MELPEDYLDALADELAPFGFDFNTVQDEAEGGRAVLFETDAESFARRYPWTDIDASYGQEWPPPCLDLWIKIDDHGDLTEITFEIYDILLWAAAENPALAGRLATLDDPEDQAAAVGQALALLLRPPHHEDADSLA
ncbi:MAG: hypothetical protein VB080_05900 [Propionicimonas sp.]|uniref:hypothetical protein n=1 Tax=Propionicimonas sp. TaxID=1955623 RepID=UPI002B1FA04D|nr:hypothetical protein [Propionicimonas sp.]MEA4943958.1 hypothetical protein [Propionicimonas sp.]MEA5052727.1 hypothetical protein [Propionicimonas sp.]MEA5119342.1 hypothetical protein [Propionicimonas sp.]